MSKEPLAKPQLGTCVRRFYDDGVYDNDHMGSIPHVKSDDCTNWQPLAKPDESRRERQVSERQAKFEKSCQDIANEIGSFIERQGISSKALIAKGNLFDLTRAVKDSYDNGCHDAESIKREARYEGNCEMLESIRGSLRGYPNLGGDIEVMKELERIKREAVRETVQKCCELECKQCRISQPTRREFPAYPLLWWHEKADPENKVCRASRIRSAFEKGE